MSALEPAFRLAVAELGLVSAAWLFVGEAGLRHGEAAVRELQDALGRAFPTLDAVAEAWLSGRRAPVVEPSEVLPLLADAARLVIVGLETTWLDPLIEALPPSVELGLLRGLELPVDADRVVANWRGRVRAVELHDFQRWAGARAAVLTFVYGRPERDGLFALPGWLRVAGPDVRTQFRRLVGWEVLRVPISAYPRWLAPAELHSFTDVVPS